MLQRADSAVPGDAPFECASSHAQLAASRHHHYDAFLESCRSLSLQALAELVRSGTDDVRISALETVGNLSFQVENRVIFLADADLLEWIYRLARDQVHRGSFPAFHALVRRQLLARPVGPWPCPVIWQNTSQEIP